VARCASGAAGDSTNLLLVTFETTRADHLGAYGYPRETSPRFDRLAGEGALFETALSVSPRTNPSLASLMTSLYPHEHGVRSLLRPLTPGNRTLAEILKEAGYQTGAIQTHPFLKTASGFAQGFEDYDDTFTMERGAKEAAQSAIRWIRQADRRRPWFLWLHFVDPHWPYEPPREVRALFGPEDPRTAALYRDLRSGRIPVGPVIFENRMPNDLIESFVDLYDGEIRAMDDALGLLLDALRELELKERTAVVITADHGESLGENDYFFEHGAFGSNPEVHVPLLLVAPGRVPPGVRSPATVRSIDIVPTILEVLNLPPEAHFRGTSLMTILRGTGGGEDRACFGEAGEKFHIENTRREIEGVEGKWRWLQRGRFKLVHIPHAAGMAERRLYDLKNDPGETQSLLSELRGVAILMERDLDSWMVEDLVASAGGDTGSATFRTLRSLGYIN
jgi:arylsulfatase A-like enzyme